MRMPYSSPTDTAFSRYNINSPTQDADISEMLALRKRLRKLRKRMEAKYFATNCPE